MRQLAAAWVGVLFFLTQQAQAQSSPPSSVRSELRRAKQSSKHSTEMLASKFKSYEIVTFNDIYQETSAGKAGSARSLRFSLDSSDTDIVIMLEPNDLRDDGYRAVAATAQGSIMKDRSDVKWFKGYVNGDRSAPARFTMEAEGPDGFFFQGNRLLFVEPLQNHIIASPELLIVYDAADVLSPQVACDANELQHYRAATQTRQASATVPELSKGLVLKIATQADYSYYQANGGQTNDHILGVINKIEGLYEKDFGITFKVTFQHVYETDNDPYTSTDALTLLRQFRDDWNANHQDVERNIAFLFNAVDLPTGTLGRAYQAQACGDINSSYGFFSYRDFLYEASIVAHEMGHMLGAEHETVAGCEADPSLMCASISRATPFKFSTTAQAVISEYLHSHACFTDPLETRVHPIPAHTDLTIESSMPNFTASLYDLLGKKVGAWTFAQDTGTIPTTDIPGGFYVLHISSWNQVRIHRIEILPP